MRQALRSFCLASCLLIATALAPAPAGNPPTDLNLVLGIDCSYSVDQTEFALQAKGLAAAFLHPDIIEAIQGGEHGAIGVTVVQWSVAESRVVAVPWRRIASMQDATRLSNAIAAMPRSTSEGGTSISGMISQGVALLETAPFAAARSAIDISADGENNNGERLEAARDFAVSRGITINGLAILNEIGYLQHYMRNRMIGGPGAFVEKADDYLDFSRAIRKKLRREIQGNVLS